jgi:small subunit ribosomal protein S8
MAMTDPIADLLVRLRNACGRGHAEIFVPASKVKAEIARVLQQEGFIQNVNRVASETGLPLLKIELRYQKGDVPIITGLKRISKPGNRVYTRHAKIPSVMRNMGVAILSTPKGVMTGIEARAQGIGGEVLCYVW